MFTVFSQKWLHWKIPSRNVSDLSQTLKWSLSLQWFCGRDNKEFSWDERKIENLLDEVLKPNFSFFPTTVSFESTTFFLFTFFLPCADFHSNFTIEIWKCNCFICVFLSQSFASFLHQNPSFFSNYFSFDLIQLPANERIISLQSKSTIAHWNFSFEVFCLN